VCLWLVGPFVYLAEEGDARVSVAGRGGALGLGVERGAVGGGEFVENNLLIDGE
jgi:hypothetical protein